jgi:glucosamine--fructose-6-phosphate aminotransferase (isomerizing)
MMALKMAKAKGSISDERYMHLVNELASVPEKVKEILADTSKIESIAKQYKGASDFLYLGRGYNFPIALEGALKLKEITYIHAEGYPAAEMKHGPIALVDENLPVVFVATKDMYYEKVVSNIQEIKARKGQVIAVATHGDSVLPTMSDHIMFVPDIDEVIAPLLSVIPLQLLSYYVGIYKGIDGMLMEYRVKRYGITMKFTAKTVSPDGADDIVFKLEGDYKDIPAAEMDGYFKMY